MATPARGPWHLAGRVAASTVGAWALAWSVAAFGTAALARAGMAYPEASTLAMLLGLLTLLVGCLCAVAARSLGRVWAVVIVAGAAMAAAARLLATA